MNWIGLWTIYLKEMQRTFAVFFQAVLSPVITTSLYFVVFGAAIGSQIRLADGMPYALFIVPGLIIMATIPNALSASSSGIYFQKFIGSIVYLLTAPLSSFEIAAGYALAAMSRALVISVIVFGIAWLFTGIGVAHPLLAVLFTLFIALTFACLGLVIGLWSKDFEQLSFVPTIILTPLSFLGGVFYSVDMLPPLWQHITLINPIYYMVDGLRWCFFGASHTNPLISIAIVSTLFLTCTALLAWMFRTGYKMKS